LSESESKQQELLKWAQAFEHAEWGVVIGSADATTLEIMNPAFARMYGYSVEELRGRPIASLYAAEDRPKLSTWIREAHEKGHINFEARHLRKDGTSFQASVDITAVKDSDHKVLYRVVNVQDITQRKQAEEALRESERRNAAIISTLNEGVVFHDFNGVITLCNSSAEQILGLSADQMLGRKSMDPRWRSIREDGTPFPGQDHPAMVTLRTGKPLSNQVMGIHKPDGTLTWISINTHPMFFPEEQRPYAVLVSFSDISEQRQMYQLLEQRVEARTRELKAILDVSHIVNSNLQLKPLLNIILQQLKQVIDYTGAGIARLDGEELIVVEYVGPIPRELMLAFHTSLRQESGYQKVARTLEPVIIDDIWADELKPLQNATSKNLLSQFQEIHSWMGIPLISRDHLIGVLRLDHVEPGHFTQTHADLGLAFANQAAVAIENARFYEQAQQLAALEERQKLARELHDSVSQALYGIALGARTARTQLERDPARLTEPLDYILSLAEAGLSEMRALIFELRPESLQNEGLVAALTKQSDALRARHRLEVVVDFSPEPDISLDVKEALYRIAQEAMQNIARHAHATRVELTLKDCDAQLELEICDNGRGFDASLEFPGHLGLQSMRERAAQVGAQFHIQSCPNAGTTISVHLSK
jgi:PAS domain S-box-containing protein